MPEIAGMRGGRIRAGFLTPPHPGGKDSVLAAHGDRCNAAPMRKDTGFPVIASADARILVLGSMPGTASLEAAAYYAHPRNAFWPIMGTLLGFDATLPYAERLGQLQRHGVALWDVVHRCQRPGSLDAAIRPDTVEANDMPGLFAGHTAIRAVYFNGATAASLYRRHVLPRLEPPWRELPRHTLPSTSPAHAAMSLDDKLRAWRCILGPLRERA